MKRNFKNQLKNVTSVIKDTLKKIFELEIIVILPVDTEAQHIKTVKLRINPEEIKIPVIFHNLRGYDSHFIMQEIGAIVKKHTYKNKKGEDKQMNINAIPNNMEKYMAFMLGNHLTFIDSFQFISSSLEKLVSNLPKEAFKYTTQKFNDKKLDLISQKGVYPHDFMDSFEKI